MGPLIFEEAPASLARAGHADQHDEGKFGEDERH